MSVTVRLSDDIDVSRGDMLVDPEMLPGCGKELHAKICWLHPRPLQRGKKYLLKHTTQTVQAAVTTIEHRINITNLSPESGAEELAMNDIGEVRLATSAPVVFDGYAANRLTGSFILIEPGTNSTVGAGMLQHPKEIARPEYKDFSI